jgi:hypothetical protein
MTTPEWKHTATRLVIKMVERRDLSTVTLPRARCSGDSCPGLLLPSVLVMPLLPQGETFEEGECKRNRSYTAGVAKPRTEISGRVILY